MYRAACRREASLVLEHLRSLATKLKNQDGYRSQFVALSKQYHTHLGDDAEGVLDRVWREAPRQQAATRPKGQPVADGDADNSRPRVWKATDLEASKPQVWLATQRIPRSGVTVLVGDMYLHHNEGMNDGQLSIRSTPFLLNVDRGNAKPPSLRRVRGPCVQINRD